jgi:hypothetical protein
MQQPSLGIYFSLHFQSPKYIVIPHKDYLQLPRIPQEKMNIPHQRNYKKWGYLNFFPRNIMKMWTNSKRFPPPIYIQFVLSFIGFLHLIIFEIQPSNSPFKTKS